MPAPVTAWRSSSETGGVHGDSTNTGSTTSETSGGQRASHSSFSFVPCSHSTNPACHSWFIVTIRELSKVGKRAGAGTHPPTPLSGGSTTSWHPLCVGCSQNMSPLQTTQPMDHSVASIPLLRSYSRASPYLLRLPVTSLILMTSGAMCSASNIDFMHLHVLPTSRPRVARPPNQNPHNHMRMSSTCLVETIPPYPLNLTPTLSDLHPYCAAKDRLEKWLPHPDSLAFLGPPETLELQGRVKMVMLEGWAESTHTTYGTGLLVYHVFCDS